MNQLTNRIAIITARGGSKRIPLKNLKAFNGKPIIFYSIQAALSSGLFDEVMVSTDNEQIAEFSLQCGASVPFRRSQENANDFASTADVISEVLNDYAQQGKHFNLACCIYPTAPFVTPELLKKGLTLLESENYDSVFPIVAFGYPIQRSLQITLDKKVSMVSPEFLNSRSQDLPKRYHDAGMFYWLRPDLFKTMPLLFGSNSGALEISELECQDIDNPSDWQIAELKYQLLHPSTP